MIDIGSRLLINIMHFLSTKLQIYSDENIITFVKKSSSDSSSAIKIDTLEKFWVRWYPYGIQVVEITVELNFQGNRLLSRNVIEANHRYIGTNLLAKDYYIVLRYWKIDGKVYNDRGYYLLFSETSSEELQCVPSSSISDMISERDSNDEFVIDLGGLIDYTF